MTDELSRELYQRLKSLARRKVSIDRVKFVFADSFPDLSDHPERIVYLHRALTHLASVELIRLPSQENRKAWLLESNPKLPAWIVVKSGGESIARTDPAIVPWLAEMSFAAELKHPHLIEVAVSINKFLIEKRRNLKPVPMRERSLQIFGDEKRLDTLVQNGSLFGGRLPLSSINAFEVEQPLAYQGSGVSGKPLLVLENHHTYWSFCNWNAHVCKYSAIVYGCGNAFSRTGRAIDDVSNAVAASKIEYFGDLDTAGLEIPVRFNLVRRREQRSTMLPATELYAWLLANGVRRPADSEKMSFSPGACDWLPSFLHAQVRELFSIARWIPQESLGTDVLIDHFS